MKQKMHYGEVLYSYEELKKRIEEYICVMSITRACGFKSHLLSQL
ncbi:hypothetical protein [Bacillus sp. FJAT-27445]